MIPDSSPQILSYILTWWPVHLSTANNVHMNVVNRLACSKNNQIQYTISKNQQLKKRIIKVQVLAWIIIKLTSFWPIINYNPVAIVKTFLFGNQLSSVKKSAKNVDVPLLSLKKHFPEIELENMI
jgi:hypothetical protein